MLPKLKWFLGLVLEDAKFRTNSRTGVGKAGRVLVRRSDSFLISKNSPTLSIIEHTSFVFLSVQFPNFKSFPCAVNVTN